MAAKDRIQAAQTNRYVQRLIEDEDLRANLMSAYGAARSAYGRVNNGKPARQALMEDTKLQNELKAAARSLRDATSALREEPQPARRRRGRGRGLILLLIGAGLAIALSEGLRSKVLDTLFGAEEEFDYSSTTAPATPAPAPVGS